MKNSGKDAFTDLDAATPTKRDLIEKQMVEIPSEQKYLVEPSKI